MIFQFGPYRIDGERRELSRSGEDIPLQPQAFSLLIYLVERHDRVVSNGDGVVTVRKAVIADRDGIVRCGNGLRSERHCILAGSLAL